MKLKAVFVLFVFFFFACSSYGPEPIEWGHDQCHGCKMSLIDKRFGAEVITDKGKIYKFDSYECLFSFLKSENPQNAKIYVVDFFNASRLIPAEKARFFISEDLRSPMGKGVMAGMDEASFRSVLPSSASLLTWTELQKRNSSVP